MRSQLPLCCQPQDLLVQDSTPPPASEPAASALPVRLIPTTTVWTTRTALIQLILTSSGNILTKSPTSRPKRSSLERTLMFGINSIRLLVISYLPIELFLIQDRDNVKPELGEQSYQRLLSLLRFIMRPDRLYYELLSGKTKFIIFRIMFRFLMLYPVIQT